MAETEKLYAANIYGEIIEITPEDLGPPAGNPDGERIRQASVVAMAELAVNGDDIGGLEQAVNIAAAFPVDVNVFWIFLAVPEEKYIPFVQAPGFNADVTMREPDFFEVTVTDRASNGPAIPSSLSIQVNKVS